MDPTLQNLVSEIVHNEFMTNWRYWFVLAFVVFAAGAAATFTAGYFKKRGENLATHKDIEEITRKIEKVKAEIQERLVQKIEEMRDSLQARHTLRFAALEKRLQAHQEAFMLCRKLLGVIHKPDKLGIRLNENKDWYDANGLYLEPTARDAFWSAWAAGQDYYSLAGGPYDPKLMKENWDKITSAINAIATAVGLPPIKGDEGLPSDTATPHAG